MFKFNIYLGFFFLYRVHIYLGKFSRNYPESVNYWRCVGLNRDLMYSLGMYLLVLCVSWKIRFGRTSRFNMYMNYFRCRCWYFCWRRKLRLFHRKLFLPRRVLRCLHRLWVMVGWVVGVVEAIIGWYHV